MGSDVDLHIENLAHTPLSLSPTLSPILSLTILPNVKSIQIHFLFVASVYGGPPHQSEKPGIEDSTNDTMYPYRGKT